MSNNPTFSFDVPFFTLSARKTDVYTKRRLLRSEAESERRRNNAERARKQALVRLLQEGGSLRRSVGLTREEDLRECNELAEKYSLERLEAMLSTMTGGASRREGYVLPVPKNPLPEIDASRVISASEEVARHNRVISPVDTIITVAKTSGEKFDLEWLRELYSRYGRHVLIGAVSVACMTFITPRLLEQQQKNLDETPVTFSGSTQASITTPGRQVVDQQSDARMYARPTARPVLAQRQENIPELLGGSDDTSISRTLGTVTLQGFTFTITERGLYNADNLLEQPFTGNQAREYIEQLRDVPGASFEPA